MLANESAKKVLTTIFENIHSTGEVQFPFLVVQGDDGVGVLEYLLEQLDSLLWWYKQDLLLLRDVPADLEKKVHALKVEVASSDQVIETKKYGPVANLGARGITNRLSLSPAGGLKIVLIEHIERMTTSAANALLKSFEEPLPWRLIIWTSVNTRRLLDTILSRAFVIATQSVGVDAFLESCWVSEKDSLAWERAFSLLGNDKEAIQGIIEEGEALEEFWVLEALVLNEGEGYRISATSKFLGKKRSDQQLLSALILRAERSKKFDLVKKLTKAKWMIAANVNADHVWYGLGIKAES